MPLRLEAKVVGVRRCRVLLGRQRSNHHVPSRAFLEDAIVRRPVKKG